MTSGVAVNEKVLRSAPGFRPRLDTPSVDVKVPGRRAPRQRSNASAPVVILRMTMRQRRTTRVLAVSVPPESASDFEELAQLEGRNKSELFREMLRVYRAYRETQSFESLQRYGAAQARRRGIRTEKDVERLIREARG